MAEAIWQLVGAELGTAQPQLISLIVTTSIVGTQFNWPTRTGVWLWCSLNTVDEDDADTRSHLQAKHVVSVRCNCRLIKVQLHNDLWTRNISQVSVDDLFEK